MKFLSFSYKNFKTKKICDKILEYMPVLYRKYRPKTFSEIVGQEHVVKTLTNAILMGMVSHAYLFYGPRGTGKTTMARLLAKAVNCTRRKSFEPCNQCISCIEISEGRAIDLIEIDAASNRGIDEIRSLREGVGVVPTKSKYKVYVIDECLTGDHLITMSDGKVKKISEIKNGEKVASIELKTGEIIEGKVRNWFKRKTNQIIEIKTPQTFLRCTPTHRLWTFRDNRFSLVQARDLKVDDFLLSPVYLPHIQKNDLTPDQLNLLALIQCDGHISKDAQMIQIEVRKDNEYFQNIVKKGMKGWGILKPPVIKITSRGTTLIRIYSKELKDIFLGLGCPAGKKSTEIDVSDTVFQAPLKSVKSYIDTCFCCEGNIDFNKSLNLYRLNFNSTSEIFVRKLQLLLKKFGISSSILKIPRKDKKYSTVYRLSLSHYNLQIFQQKIGLSLKRKANILAKCSLKKEKQDTIPIEKIIIREQKKIKLSYPLRASLGIYPDIRQHLSRRAVINFIKVGGVPELNKYLQFRYEKIKKIKIQNEEEIVYDFTVENIHTFIANGICSSNCHQLTKEASNALLKTLEEPPRHVIFVLCTTEFSKVLPTITSRCQRFEFRKLNLSQIVRRLEIISKKEKIKIEKEAIELIARTAQGSIRDAESLLDEVMITVPKSKESKIEKERVGEILGIVGIEVVSRLVDLLAKKDEKGALGYLSEIFERGVDIENFAKKLTSYLRDLFLVKINPKIFKEETIFTKEERENLQRQEEYFSEDSLKEMIRIFLDAQNQVRWQDLPQLPLELAVIDSIKQLTTNN